METPHFETFEEFWPYYVKEHQKKATRVLHFVGTTAAMASLAGGLFTKRRWLLALAPVVGYGPSWIGHFFVEKNKPATFKYPVWSLRADLVMWKKMITFGMDAEVERVLAEDRAKAEGAASRPQEAAAATPHATDGHDAPGAVN
jgi:hypothetical protein